MTPQEIQYYSVKMAEMMGWKYKIQYSAFHKEKMVYTDNLCGEFTISKFHTSYDWQIPIYQKVYDKNLDLVVDGKIEHVKEFMQLRESFMHRIDRGAPLDSFAIICKAIDLIEKGGKG